VTDWDPARIGVPTWRGGGGPVSAAWSLQHALTHLFEHVAHAELTRQVIERHG
jgi:hypothetical protein